jgi:GntR family transcriptional regulator, carbon starvation induced regulator
LQGHYGFSSSPLREALCRLTQEGLVRAGWRALRLAPISSEDLNDITHMRLMLDAQALRTAIELGDDAWEGAIVAAFHRLEKVESRLSDGPVILDEEWSEVHRSFHLALIVVCVSERQRMWSASLFGHFSARHRQTGRWRGWAPAFALASLRVRIYNLKSRYRSQLCKSQSGATVWPFACPWHWSRN